MYGGLRTVKFHIPLLLKKRRASVAVLVEDTCDLNKHLIYPRDISARFDRYAYYYK